jgi:hypothetical protein
VEDEQQLLKFMNGDPAAKINRYEYYAMNAVVPTEGSIYK